MLTIEEMKAMKAGGQKISVLTAYDFATARLLEESGIDIILVGDSLGMVFQGRENTKDVELSHMLYHGQAVRRGAPDTFLVIDLPKGSYDTPEEGVRSSRALMKAGANGVKLEGCPRQTIEAILQAGIPVMGHLGLLPQTAENYKVRGKTSVEALSITEDAKWMDQAGVFSLVLECIPLDLAQTLTQAIAIPTIGIGAGKFTDGQVLVVNDLLGLTTGYLPKFVEKFADLHKVITQGVTEYRRQIQAGEYPQDKHSYH